MAADESTTQDTHETAEGSTTPVEATEEETAAEVAESPAGEAAEATAAPDVRFDPTNPFAVPEGLLPLIEAETVERRRRRPAADPVPEGAADDAHADDEDDEDRPAVSRRRRRRRRGTVDMELAGGEDGDPEDTVTRVRAPRRALSTGPEAVQGVKGSTRLEAKRQRRRESRSGGRRRTVITEAEFLARRESVDRKMLVRQREHRIQIAVLEDGVLAEHFVSNTTQDSMIGNVYLGKVQNVLPSMEAAFVDIGRGRNAVLYAGEVDWDAAQLDGKAKKIENALKSGDTVLVQVTKDPVGHKGARLTSQISLPGRYLVYVPGGTMTGISRKLPDVERARLKKILKDHLPQDAGVIVRTAAEGTSEQELQNDINRLRVQWEGIQEKASSTKTLAPELLYAEPDLTIKTVRDVFNEDFSAMLVQGEATWDSIEAYVTYVAPHLLDRLHHWVPEDHDGEDLYATHRVDEQLHKALERKVYLPSGGSLVIDRTEAMTVVDVNTGKFTGSGGNLEETVTKNNLEAAEEVVRQLRLRDIGGIIVIDFIDMVLESNQDLVLRRLVECLGRDRTKHQVAEVTSLGLVQMTRKRMGTGLVEVFSEVCEHCGGRGILIQDTPVERNRWGHEHRAEPEARRRNKRRRGTESGEGGSAEPTAAELTEEERLRAERAAAARTALMSIAKASGKAADEEPSEDAAPRAEDAPEEAADEVRPSPAGDAEEQGESESGGRRRKRRGRRRGRGRGGDDAARSAEEQDAPAEHPAEAAGEPAPAEAGAPDPAETATEDADADSASDAPAAQAEADEDGRSGGRRRSRRRGGRRAESPKGSGAPASAPEASVEAEQDPEEPAGAAEAEEALAAEEAPASPEPAAVVTFDGEPVAVPRRRRSRRATSDGVSAPRPSGMDALEAAVDRRAEDAAAAAQRSPATPAATPTAAPEPAPAPVAGEGPAAAAPRRRSRRAVSADGATVQVQEGAAAGGGRFTAQAAQAAPAGETAAPVMLGVGVKAADIVRGE